MTEAVADPAAVEQKEVENPNPTDFRDEEKVQRYLKRKTKRNPSSDDEEEYSQGEAKMIKQDPKYGEKDLYKKIMQLKHKAFIDDDTNENETTKEKKESDENNKENVDENNVIKTEENKDKEKEKEKDKKDKGKALTFELAPPPFNHRFFDKINSLLFKKYFEYSLEKIMKYLKKEEIRYIKSFFASTRNPNFFSFLYFTPEPICALKKDLILHFLIDKPNVTAPYEIYQMIKYNYFYCEEFKELILTKKIMRK
jgi:hypothetical protein